MVCMCASQRQSHRDYRYTQRLGPGTALGPVHILFTRFRFFTFVQVLHIFLKRLVWKCKHFCGIFLFFFYTKTKIKTVFFDYSGVIVMVLFWSDPVCSFITGFSVILTFHTYTPGARLGPQATCLTPVVYIYMLKVCPHPGHEDVDFHWTNSQTPS